VNTAAEVLKLFDSLGVTIRVNARGKLAVRPADRVTAEIARQVKAVEPAIRQLLQERAAEQRYGALSASETDRVVEATFISAVTPIRAQPATEFPVCPCCKVGHYWLESNGRVICRECRIIRFVVTAIQSHPVN
jgi:hypothetical protein